MVAGLAQDTIGAMPKANVCHQDTNVCRIQAQMRMAVLKMQEKLGVSRHKNVIDHGTPKSLAQNVQSMNADANHLLCQLTYMKKILAATSAHA